MTVLLDTQDLLWAASEPSCLSPTQLATLEDAAVDLYVSTISIAEIEIKRAIGKLQMRYSCEDLRASIGAQWLPLQANHAMALRSLPLAHRDPFDRLLLAQALNEPMDLMSSDGVFDAYSATGVRLLR